MKGFWVFLGILLMVPSSLFALQIRMNGRVITPNSDGINDAVSFDWLDASETPLETSVLTVQGRRVATLRQVSASRWSWDGRGDNGSVVESGVYLVQILQGAQHWHGVLNVAK